MFKTVALNLGEHGIFVGVVPHPTDDLEQRATASGKPPFDRMFPRNKYTERLPHDDGWGLRVSIDDEGVEFMTWHMSRSVYEEAARLGGMRGKLEWRREVLLGDEWKETHRPQLSAAEWKVREENPHFGILVVYKN